MLGTIIKAYLLISIGAVVGYVTAAFCMVAKD